MRNEFHALPSGLATCSRHHPITEVQRGDTRSRTREPNRMPAGAAAQIGDREVTDVAKERIEMLLLEEDDRVVLRVVDGGPTIVALLRREVLDRPIRRNSRSNPMFESQGDGFSVL